MRTGFYAVFEAQNAAVTLSGQSFNGFEKGTGKPKYDKIYMAKPYFTELSIFYSAMTDHWNPPIGLWYFHCIISRIPWKHPLILNLCVFVYSISWNGFYPSIFLDMIYITVMGGNFEYLYRMMSTKPQWRKPWVHIAIM